MKSQTRWVHYSQLVDTTTVNVDDNSRADHQGTDPHALLISRARLLLALFAIIVLILIARLLQWQVVDSALVFTPNPEKNHGLNNLMTDSTYTNFILSLDWKISEGGNSGVFWGVFENENYTLPYLTGPEIQILDNEGHPDSENKTHLTGSLFDMITPSENVALPVGEWNTMVLEINHKTNTGNVWLNGKQIVTFPISGPEWDNMIQNSKFKDWKGFGSYKTGRIGLQDHGNAVSFKNIKIKDMGE